MTIHLNGLVMRKRYKVFDADTGEEVEDAVVLEPTKDAYAYTAMMVYARTAGFDDHLVRVFKLPNSLSDDMREYLIENMDLDVGAQTHSLSDLDTLRTICHASEKGPVEDPYHTYTFNDLIQGLENMGWEFVTTVIKLRGEVRT